MRLLLKHYLAARPSLGALPAETQVAGQVPLLAKPECQDPRAATAEVRRHREGREQSSRSRQGTSFPQQPAVGQLWRVAQEPAPSAGSNSACRGLSQTGTEPGGGDSSFVLAAPRQGSWGGTDEPCTALNPSEAPTSAQRLAREQQTGWCQVTLLCKAIN